MALQTVQMYRVVCDAMDCDESPQDEEFYAWLQPDGALNDLHNADNWYEGSDGKHFCPDHAPVCPHEDCGVSLHDDEFGVYCEDHAPEEPS